MVATWMIKVETYKDVVGLLPLLNGSLKIACGLQDGTCPRDKDDLTVLAGGLAGAGAVVVPLGQLAGIGHRAGEGLYQHQPDQYDFTK